MSAKDILKKNKGRKGNIASLKLKQNKKPQQKKQGNRRKFRRDNIQNVGFNTNTGMANDSKLESRVLENTEFVMQVNSTIGFGQNSLNLNPGLPLSFPWLSKQAVQWEKYHFEYIEFAFVPTITGYDPNAKGTLAIFFDNDVYDGPPGTMNQVQTSQPMAFDLPYKKVILKLNPKFYNISKGTQLMVRDGTSSTGNRQQYDTGIIYVCTEGQTSSGVLLGNLMVRYKVRFMMPVLEATLSPIRQYTVSQFAVNAFAMSDNVLYDLVFDPPNINNYNGIEIPYGPANSSLMMPAGGFLFNSEAIYTPGIGATPYDFEMYIYNETTATEIFPKLTSALVPAPQTFTNFFYYQSPVPWKMRFRIKANTSGVLTGGSAYVILVIESVSN